jgi:hypothetical protein
MESVFKTLDSLEALITRVFVWIVYIPKTVIWIIFNPGKIPAYINGELNPDDKKKEEKRPPFEGFIPPVILLLTVALLPALLLGFLPKTGATITRPTETKSVVEGSLQSLKMHASSADSYEVEAKFTSSANDLRYIVTWWVEKNKNNDQASETQESSRNLSNIFRLVTARKLVEEKINDGQYLKLDQSEAVHSELDASGGTITKDGNNTVRDTFSYPFKEYGSYYINVRVQKVIPVEARGKSSPKVIEEYSDYIYVQVPERNNPEHKGFIDASRIKTAASDTGQRLSLENFSGLLKKESTIFLAICMLFPPLLFAFVSDLVTRKGGNDKTLRETFYAECYYFSPLSLAFWAFYYSLFFFTGDVLPKLFGSVGIYIPLLAALLWFIVVETNAVADVSEQDKITQPVAFLIVIFNLSILASLGSLIFVARHDSRMQDLLRVSLIRLYVLAGLALLVAYFVNGRLGMDRAKLVQLRENLLNRWKGRKQPQVQDQQSEQPPQVDTRKKPRKGLLRKVVISLSVIAVIFCCIPACLIALAPTEDTQTVASPATQTPIAVLASNIQLPENSGTYTEGFDGNLDDWGPYLLRGGEAKVIIQPENGSLHFRLSPQKDQYPAAYRVNNAYEYTDVQVETTVINNSTASSEVSLICQYSPEKGWYEFAVSNSGEYSIYARDETLGTWTELAHDSSPAIKKGLSEKNTYQVICEGNKLSLSINGTTVDPVQDKQFNFKQGKIGLGLYSIEGKDVDVSFESLKVSKPEIALPELAATPGSVAGGSPGAIPTPDSKRYYTEDFDAPSSAWGPLFMMNGSESQVSQQVENGTLHFSIFPQKDQFPAAYLLNNAFNYSDVQIDALVKNNGNNANGVSLICQYNDKGWYEFEISNSGTYTIYAFDAIQWAYTILDNGYSNQIKSGLSENSYTAVCKGNELALLVNGAPIREPFQDTTFNFTDGQVGIALTSPEGLPVDISFESLKLSNPSPDQQAEDPGSPANPEATDVPVAEVASDSTPAPATSSYFTDELDGGIDRWKMYGDPGQVTLPPENGRLHFQLAQKNGQTPSVYFINDEAEYGNVQVEVVATNNGNNSNGVDMVCQLSDNGQYEFEVSNSGEYAIYAFDARNNAYTLLTSGSSPAVKTGMSENIYTATCQGNELTLMINGTQVVEGLQETTFNFTGGKAGFGVTSRKGFPVDLYIESVKVSEPQ